MESMKSATDSNRPVFPKRAVVTAGMPYGNKALHFGHIGGMFVHADTFTRFLRDRLGKDNVLFISGTDCYGSPIMENYRKLSESGYNGTMEDYVLSNHDKQKKTLSDYGISLDIYGASAFGESGKMHKKVSEGVFNTLYDNGWIVKLSTPQFFDPDAHILLNGRQVLGRCPVEGCSADKAYADECDCGHQYMPSELLDPISTLSGKTPFIGDVTNWYFVLDEWSDMLLARMDYLVNETNTRRNQLDTIREFLKPPALYIQRKFIEEINRLTGALPEHDTIDDGKKASVTLIFKRLSDRDKAREVLRKNAVRYRTGKTLVPFRLSGNINWGVPVPDKDGLDGQTFWVWPESLWAPISFTRTCLEQKGFDENEWRRWWDSDDAKVYQFIGQDNIYFYGIAEMAIFTALKYKRGEKPDMINTNLPHIIANNHILFMDKKAGSSSEIKPPMADALLEYYTADQLRMHFLSLGLAGKSMGFKPQMYMLENERQGADNVLTAGNVLTNVYNRIIRSCFYSLQTWFEGLLPSGEPCDEIVRLSDDAVLEYERHMYNHDFHKIISLLDTYIRSINKHWVSKARQAELEDDMNLKTQVLIDCFHGVKAIAVLVHPIAPIGCEKVRKYLNVDERLWDWSYIFKPLRFFLTENHKFLYLEPKTDFFEKLENQFSQS